MPCFCSPDHFQASGAVEDRNLCIENAKDDTLNLVRHLSIDLVASCCYNKSWACTRKVVGTLHANILLMMAELQLWVSGSGRASKAVRYHTCVLVSINDTHDIAITVNYSLKLPFTKKNIFIYISQIVIIMYFVKYKQFYYHNDCFDN